MEISWLRDYVPTSLPFVLVPRADLGERLECEQTCFIMAPKATLTAATGLGTHKEKSMS